MPLYEYCCRHCGRTHTCLRKFERRLDAVACVCGAKMDWMFPVPHIEPDGIYSYAPNIGTAEDWERKQGKIKEREEQNAERRNR